MKEEFRGLMVGVIVGVFIGIGWVASISELDAVLVERGIKQYNQETGVLEWVE